MKPEGSVTSTPPAGRSLAPKPRRRRFKAYVGGSLVVAVLLVTLYISFMLWWSYSEGERAGVLQKFSKRGWICKTYEGEVAQYVVGGVAPQIWHFSVRDAAVAEQLHRAVGQQVRLHYTEHPGLPTNCFGETDYFADGLEIMTPPQPAPAQSGYGVESAAQPAPGAAVQP